MSKSSGVFKLAWQKDASASPHGGCGDGLGGGGNGGVVRQRVLLEMSTEPEKLAWSSVASEQSIFDLPPELVASIIESLRSALVRSASLKSMVAS